MTHTFIHDKYVGFIKGYDLALLYLKTEITMTDYVQPICLPKTFAPLGKDYYVAGWGRNEKGKKIYNVYFLIGFYPVISCY